MGGTLSFPVPTYYSITIVDRVLDEVPAPTRSASPCSTPPATRPTSTATNISNTTTGRTTLVAARVARPPPVLLSSAKAGYLPKRRSHLVGLLTSRLLPTHVLALSIRIQDAPRGIDDSAPTIFSKEASKILGGSTLRTVARD